MSWWNPFAKSKPAPVRRSVTGPQIAALLQEALRGRVAPTYRHIAQKQTMALCDMPTLEAAAEKARKPWQKDVWECEDIARAALNRLQEQAANQGRSYAAGMLRAKAPEGTDLHVYLWCFVEHPVLNRSLAAFYDPTAMRWVTSEALYDVDYTIT